MSARRCDRTAAAQRRRCRRARSAALVDEDGPTGAESVRSGSRAALANALGPSASVVIATIARAEAKAPRGRTLAAAARARVRCARRASTCVTQVTPRTRRGVRVGSTGSLTGSKPATAVRARLVRLVRPSEQFTFQHGRTFLVRDHSYEPRTRAFSPVTVLARVLSAEVRSRRPHAAAPILRRLCRGHPPAAAAPRCAAGCTTVATPAAQRAGDSSHA